MNTLFFWLSVVFFVAGLVGVVRGGVGRRWVKTRTASFVLTIVGLIVLFVTSAPPLYAVDSVKERFVPPTPAQNVLDTVQSLVPNDTAQAVNIEPEQRQAFPQWERQLLEAYAKADRTLQQAEYVLHALNDGSLDRFTAWVRLGMLAEDIKQAKLVLHDLVPPSVLNLTDQKTLAVALDELKNSLLEKRNGLRAFQRFVRTVDNTDLRHAEYAFRLGEEGTVSGLTKVAGIKMKLEHSTPAASLF